jgi:hypothetical protein
MASNRQFPTCVYTVVRGEGKGITFNTGEVYQRVYLYIKNFSNIL